METIYLLYARTKDGQLVAMSFPFKPRWFPTLPEARTEGAKLAAAGIVDKVWIVKAEAVEEAVPVAVTPAPRKEELPPRADVHMFYDLDAERPLHAEYDDRGDECSDKISGQVHRKAQLDTIVEVLHKLGFSVTVGRVSKTTVIEDPTSQGRRGGAEG